MLPHVHAEVVLPLGDVAALGAHVILGVGVGQHVLGQVAHVSAREVAQLALMWLLAFGGGEGVRGERRQVRPGEQMDIFPSQLTLPPSASGSQGADAEVSGDHCATPPRRKMRGKRKASSSKTSVKVHSGRVLHTTYEH